MKSIVRQIAVVLATVVTIATNALANILPINGQLTGAISDSFPVRFTPAGYVFSIWGVIYLGLIVYSVYQALPSQRNRPLQNTVGWIYVASAVFNSTWILAFHYLQFPLSLVIMLALLITLTAIYLQLKTGLEKAAPADQWLLRLPFSIYLAWICVATIANATIVLYDLGWNGQPFTPDLWAALMIVVGTVLASIIALTRRDVGYIAVFVWAYIGIVVAQSDSLTVAATAALMTAVILAILGFSLARRTPPPTALSPTA